MRTSNTEILHPLHPQPRIHHSRLIALRPHPTRAARMIRRADLFPHIPLPLLVILRDLASLRPGPAHIRLGARALRDDLVPELDAFGEHGEVEWRAEVVVVDEGLGEGVGGGEADCAARLGAHEHCEDGEYGLLFGWSASRGARFNRKDRE